MAQANFLQYGVDEGNVNYGQDIFVSHISRISDYNNRTAQGLQTEVSYFNGKIAFTINPKTNLRLEAGGIVRQEKNTIARSNTAWFTFGVRSSFRNIYQDI